MIVANAKQVLTNAQLRHSSGECNEIAQTILLRASDEMNVRFSNMEKIVDNRNSVCLKLYAVDRPYLLKVNKNSNTHEVTGSASRMSSTSRSAIKGAFTLPAIHYIDREFDATIMEFIPGTRFDTILAKSTDLDLIEECINKAAYALAIIHELSLDGGNPAITPKMDNTLAELTSVFPSFVQRNLETLVRIADLTPLRPVVVHGDFSPKNILFDDSGSLFVIDFTGSADSFSPLRDISIFAVGLARALALSARLRSGASSRLSEALVQKFLKQYLLRFRQVDNMEPRILSQQLVLFELLRLAEMKIWLDGYRAFDEAFLGWVKARIGGRFIASQLRRLERRLT